MRSTRLLALVLALVPAAVGCGDDIKFPDPIVPAPALNGVFPADGFSGRSMRVQVSGDNTVFGDNPSVNFGAGITVDAVEVASVSSLFVDLTLSSDATLGLRTVTVTDGDVEITLTDAFEVRDALIVQPLSTLPQGGIGFIRIINLDEDNPFLGDLDITAGAGTTIVIDNFIGNEIQATVFLDTDATSGLIEVEDALGTSIVVGRGNQMEVQVRPATPMGTSGKGQGFLETITLDDTTALLSFTGTSALNIGAALNNTSGIDPILVWLVGGKWKDAQGFSTDDFSASLVPTTNNETMFIVLFDPDFFVGGEEYDVIANEFEPLPNVMNVGELEPNNTGATAHIAPGAQTLFNASLTDVNDFDVIKVTLNGNQGIRVITTGGLGGLADTDIDIFDAPALAAGDLVIAAQDDDDIQAGEILSTDQLPVNQRQLAAGDYFIRIRSSPFANPAGQQYHAAIVLFDRPQ